MAQAQLVTVGCVVVSLCIMLAGQYAANLAFPVTSDASLPPVETTFPTSEMPLTLLFRLYVPFWAPIAHVGACIVAGLIGGFLAARLTPNTFWPVWSVALVLGFWELGAVADIPKSISFSVFAAATCVAAAWLGAVASHARAKSGRE